ncbi:hydroquinone glucosyltransferase [Ricinus communis]|uniref:hydroquinone glucosyltransferase n=1 Tax=Ricinus communis TaxID=3988 RepID=UPI00201A6C02|nr:hydroquinone glucosyltransferase [Ricinus communis]
MAGTQTQSTTHVAILPSPGMGHLIPLVELAKRLVHQHNLSITFIVPTDGPPSKAQKSVLGSLPSTITSAFLPPVDLSDTPSDAKIETIISLTVARSLPSLRDVLKSLVSKTRLVALVADLFGTDAFDVAREFNISPYIFFPSTAMTLSLIFYLPKLDEKVSCEYRELQEPVKIPGCVPIHGNKLLDPVQDRKNDAYKWFLHHSKRYKLADGIMVNSFTDLEGGAIKALQEEEPAGKPPVYPVGPLVNMGSSSSREGAECLRWLDEQPHGSVLYVSFGSGGTLSYDQINELALGLEMSEQRFLWVARSPNDGVANATFFSVQSQKDPFDFLPKGFLDRTKDRGLVVPSWAPQAQVLSHGSTGGFLTHCGWNSTLESVINGVPLIAWPLYAEQKMNAVMLTEDIKVALMPKASESGLIGRQEIANTVRSLVEGEEGKKVRHRMKDLKNASIRVLGEDGSSTQALSKLILKWKN